MPQNADNSQISLKQSIFAIIFRQLLKINYH